MKVLHIGQLIGGIDVYIRNIVSHTSPDITHVIVCGNGDNFNRDFFDNRGIVLYQVDLYRKLSAWNDIKSFCSIMKLIRSEKPDVIHCHSAKGGFLGRMAGYLTKTRTLYTPHAFSFLSSPKLIKRLSYKLLERVAVFDSYLLACSESERELAIEQVGYKKERALVWQNSIPAIPAEDGESFMGDYRDNDYICYMARPSYQKNPSFLIKVMKEVHKRLPNVRFCLLGIGYHSPMVSGLKSGIHKYGLDGCVDIFPWLPHEKCLEYIRHSKIYITVSLYEGMSLTLLEAMSLGKAVVAPDVVGNKDCVEDGVNGFLLPFDEKLFADRVEELMANDDLRAAMEANSLRLFEERFMIDKRIVDLNNIYKNDYRG